VTGREEGKEKQERRLRGRKDLVPVWFEILGPPLPSMSPKRQQTYVYTDRV